MRTWIRDPLAILTDGPGWERGLVIDGGQIAEPVGSGTEPQQIDEVVEARDLVLLPGLINTHHHFYQTLTRACSAALNKPLFPWLTSLYPIWSGLTPEMIDSSTRLAAAEMLLSGCTTAVDHHYVFSAATENAVDLQVAACRELGLRAVLTRGSMSLGQSDGGLPPDKVVQDQDIILADSERVVQRYHDPHPHADCQIALAPCSPFSVTTELMRASAELAAREGVALHTHLAETEDENAFCLERYGMRPLDYLEDCGWLQRGTWLAHGIHFEPGEIERLGNAGVGIAHCPTSNMFLGSGICRVGELIDAGAHVGLALDGSASNDGSNLMQEVRQAMLLQRLRAGIDPKAAERVPADQIAPHLHALQWATAGGADLLQRPELGRIEVGAAADLALFALDEPRFSGSDDPLAALVLCGAHHAQAVMVAGQWRVRGGDLVGTDLDLLRAEHSALARQLVAAVA